MKKILLITIIFLASLGLIACQNKKPLSTAEISYEQHDYPRAFNELVKLAKTGKPKYQYALGYMYYYGLGVAKDQSIALFWIRKASDQKYPPAMFALDKITAARARQ